MQTTLSIQGMHCVSCKTLIEEVINEQPNVTSCEVDPTSGRTTINHDAPLDMEGMKKAITALGDYHVTPIV